ncbi:MAG: ABC transporter permease [Ignavibacteriaceae bacterium]|nr:ABC transporter permease [Ignavibacteriaceae bacterium]NUM71977.1 ABC transporter permease [Ignavibacteriaceae bacterium]
MRLLFTKKDFNYSNFVVEFLAELIEDYKNRRLSNTVLIRQILFTGYEALWLISLSAVSISGLLILQGNAVFSGFTQSDVFFTIFVNAVIRELSCLITALIVLARSGTAIATELGNMQINNETESLISMGISPVSYLVIPRVIGVIAAIVTLTVYFNIAALAGGWFITLFFAPYDISEFIMDLFSVLSAPDILMSLLKSFMFGFAIASVSSYQGFKVTYASTEVPQRTIKAVVYSIGSIIVIDIILSLLYYLILT